MPLDISLCLVCGLCLLLARNTKYLTIVLSQKIADSHRCARYLCSVPHLPPACYIPPVSLQCPGQSGGSNVHPGQHY